MLRLAANRLSSVPLTALQSLIELRALDLSDNPLTALHRDTLASATHLASLNVSGIGPSSSTADINNNTMATSISSIVTVNIITNTISTTSINVTATTTTSTGISMLTTATIITTTNIIHHGHQHHQQQHQYR